MPQSNEGLMKRSDFERYFKETGLTITPPRLQQMWDQDTLDRETAIEAFTAVWEVTARELYCCEGAVMDAHATLATVESNEL